MLYGNQVKKLSESAVSDSYFYKVITVFFLFLINVALPSENHLVLNSWMKGRSFTHFCEFYCGKLRNECADSTVKKKELRVFFFLYFSLDLSGPSTISGMKSCDVHIIFTDP